MILRVNPNRMELIRLRRRLSLAQRGHKLLQDKLEEMMRRFLMLLKDIDIAKVDFQSRTQKIMQDLLYCRMTASEDEFKKSLAGISAQLVFDVSAMRVMNVRVPVFDVKELKIEKAYDFFKTSGQLDMVVAGAGEYLASLLKLAQLLKSLDILSYEIERTRRRVNALEYMLIPSIQGTIRFITQKLNEFERGNLVRLMRVKEIVRSH
ncbi:MAG TPA: V-type ATP synthase subunit D [Patescibacteria group bacterium]|nr:V-type ATP synthase subunit D [Patescibacteria group bacterium]